MDAIKNTIEEVIKSSEGYIAELNKYLSSVTDEEERLRVLESMDAVKLNIKQMQQRLSEFA